MITKFKEFINESVRDILQPISDEDIKKELDKQSVYNRIMSINYHGFLEKFYPTDDEVNKHFEDFDVFEKAKKLKSGIFSRYKHLIPSEKELIDKLNTITDTYDKIEKIVELDLPYKYLPENAEKFVIDRIKNILSYNRNEQYRPNLSLKYIIDTKKNDVIKVITMDGLEVEKWILNTIPKMYKIPYEKLNLKSLVHIKNTIP